MLSTTRENDIISVNMRLRWKTDVLKMDSTEIVEVEKMRPKKDFVGDMRQFVKGIFGYIDKPI